MKHIKTYEEIYELIESTEDKLSDAIVNHKYKKLKNLIDNVSDINYQRPLDKTTFLMCAVINNNMIAFDLLVKAGADWNIVEIDGWDFLELIEIEDAKKIIDKYPEEYKLYLAKKDTSKYNL